MSSKYFGARELATICRLGDYLTPGDDQYPSFSKLGCIEAIDEILEYTPEQDRGDLKLLLTVMSFLPMFFLRGLFGFLEWAFETGFPIPGVLRIVRFGIRGIVVSLYYSGSKGAAYMGFTPLELMNYDVKVVTNEVNFGARTGADTRGSSGEAKL